MNSQPLAPQELADFICGELDELMKSHGFLAGQSGVGDDVGIIYCIPHDEFRGRFPRLAPMIQHGDDGACTDLNINSTTGPQAHLYDIRFEGVSIEELLADEGADFVGEAEAITDLKAPDGAIRLRTVIENLLARHKAT